MQAETPDPPSLLPAPKAEVGSWEQPPHTGGDPGTGSTGPVMRRARCRRPRPPPGKVRAELPPPCSGCPWEVSGLYCGLFNPGPLSCGGPGGLLSLLSALPCLFARRWALLLSRLCCYRQLPAQPGGSPAPSHVPSRVPTSPTGSPARSLLGDTASSWVSMVSPCKHRIPAAPQE